MGGSHERGVSFRACTEDLCLLESVIAIAKTEYENLLMFIDMKKEARRHKICGSSVFCWELSSQNRVTGAPCTNFGEGACNAGSVWCLAVRQIPRL